MEEITSLSNPKIKDLILLQQKSKLRRERGVFVIEGRKEIENAVKGGFELLSIFFLPTLISPAKAIQTSSKAKLFAVSEKVYEKVAYREGTEGIMAIAAEKKLELKDLSLGNNPLIIILEGIEKPGNIGAVLRTTDAVNADAVIICNPVTDIFNPNIIRSSLGGVFTQQIVCTSSADAIKWLKSKNISILTAQLQDSVPYYEANMKEAVAIVIGTEDKGLSQEWRLASNKKINIPMLGILDSLNLSVSAAILSYEAIRQRTTNTCE